MRSLFNKNLLLIVVAAFGCALWLLPLISKQKDIPIFISPDPYYHARRVLINVNNFPNIPVFDYYISYPTGNYCIWPPLFDFSAALVSWLLFLGHPSISQVESVCAVMPVLWGILVILLIFQIGNKFFNSRMNALLASFIATILPVTSFYARAGYFDHHISETFGLLLIFYFLINDDSNWMRKYLKLGFAFGISLLLWQGAILFIGLSFILLLVHKEFKSSISFLTAFIIILPFSVDTHFIDSPFSYRGLSYLHLSLLLIATLIMWVMVIMRSKNRLKIVAVIPIFFLFILLFYLLRTKSFINGLFFIFKNDPWLATILEFQPLLVQSGYIDNLTVKQTIGLSYYVWPAMLLITILENRKNKSIIYFIFFCLFTGLISFIGRRYGIWFIPFFSLIFSYTLIKISKLFSPKIGIAFSTVVLFLNFSTIDIRFYGMRFDVPTRDEINACRWINDSLPKTSYVYKPNSKPEYGIMCFWDSGHYIVYLGQKPVTASNFGNDAPNFQIVSQFFLTQTEEDALNILKKLESPYVYMYGVLRNIYLSAKYLKVTPQEFLNIYYTKDKAGKPITIMEPNSIGIATSSYRLSQYLGSGFYFKDKFYPPYRHFRLRYFSGSVRIFEIVKGAVIKGKSLPNTSVKVSCKIQLPNITFDYFDSVSTNNNGEFLITVPYPTNYDNGYEIFFDTKMEKTIFVSEDNIKYGDTVYVK
ncbi:MAG: STT3 domain-containing protein [candidate division WOR-3 bacterium]